MEVCIGVSKVNKYAVSESGDTVETVERPNGGLYLYVVLVDGKSRARREMDRAGCTPGDFPAGRGRSRRRQIPVHRACRKVSATLNIFQWINKPALVISRTTRLGFMRRRRGSNPG
jgi:hypothetical protein